MSASAIPAEPSAEAPEWIHLLNLGEQHTADSRGPYQVADLEEIIAASLQAAEGLDLPIDENHATDLAAPKGGAAPARGWIKELQARSDGIWGRVEWTKAGREMVQERAYRAISPVVTHDKTKRIRAILRASLVNRPNLRGLAALNMETDEMSFLQKLAKALGLGEDASEADVLVAVKKSGNSDTTAMQSALSDVSVALGLAEDADPSEIVTAAQAAMSSGDDSDEIITSLQSELAGVTTQLNELRSDRTREKAEAFVDGAIKRNVVGVKPQRERYIAMHQRDADETEALINGLPTLGPSGTSIEPPAAKGDTVSLNSAQREAAKLLGIPAADYAKTLETEREQQETF
ncbi:phage protease [Litorisediminicola beolgyonensis]|uniref:Phage protease n=2 Tax=Litorisediminicola beolgyonensis TaxID=1173614 RepID=A0ABW3ZJN6_9RHOB